MPHPVVHLEIIGRHPERLHASYSELFGRDFDTSAPIAVEVPESGRFGFTDDSAGKSGLPAGVGGGPDHPAYPVLVQIPIALVLLALLTRATNQIPHIVVATTVFAGVLLAPTGVPYLWMVLLGVGSCACFAAGLTHCSCCAPTARVTPHAYPRWPRASAT